MNSEPLLGRYLRKFLGEYLPCQRNASRRTIQAYRDALKLLLQFAATERNCSVADLSLAHLNRKTILAFLEDIEKSRGNGVITRNHRLAAIRSFFRFVSNQAPELVDHCRQITAISPKRTNTAVVGYLTREEMQAIFSAISLAARNGRRDDALLRLLYNTGARVQEIVDLAANNLYLDGLSHVELHGKGGKTRICPLWDDTITRLKRFFAEKQIDPNSSNPIFTNRNGGPLTRFGVRYILTKYVSLAAKKQKSLAQKNVHPHTLRHSTAVHLLQAGVDVNTIRCYLGHANIATTNRYIEIDLAMKRTALEKVNPPKGSRVSASISNKSLLSWLESL